MHVLQFLMYHFMYSDVCNGICIMNDIFKKISHESHSDLINLDLYSLNVVWRFFSSSCKQDGFRLRASWVLISRDETACCFSFFLF